MAAESCRFLGWTTGVQQFNVGNGLAHRRIMWRDPAAAGVPQSGARYGHGLRRVLPSGAMLFRMNLLAAPVVQRPIACQADLRFNKRAVPLEKNPAQENIAESAVRRPRSRFGRWFAYAADSIPTGAAEDRAEGMTAVAHASVVTNRTFYALDVKIASSNIDFRFPKMPSL